MGWGGPSVFMVWHQRVTVVNFATLKFYETTEVPYILEYKSQNLRQNLDIKVRGATYTRIIKKLRIFF